VRFTDIALTVHAFQRYRERFDPAATDEVILAKARAAEPAPGWVKRFIPPSSPAIVYLRNGPVLFVVTPRGRRRELGVVVTCMSMEVAEARRRGFGKKRNKLYLRTAVRRECRP
jgi:hypothetical protein